MNLKEYIGIPYKHLGRDHLGVDCFGLIWLLYKEKKGITLPDYVELKYSVDWYKKENHIVNNITSNWEEVRDRIYQPFDIFLFQCTTSVVNHVAMYIDDFKLIHVQEGINAHIFILDDKWKARLYKVLRYKGV
jgi:cell wall-associated NlpC family hydrolase